MSWREAPVAWSSLSVHVTTGHRLWIASLATGRRPEAWAPNES